VQYTLLMVDFIGKLGEERKVETPEVKQEVEAETEAVVVEAKPKAEKKAKAEKPAKAEKEAKPSTKKAAATKSSSKKTDSKKK